MGIHAIKVAPLVNVVNHHQALHHVGEVEVEMGEVNFHLPKDRVGLGLEPTGDQLAGLISADKARNKYEAAIGLDDVREREALVKAELGAIELAGRRFGIGDIGGGAVLGCGDCWP